METTINVQNLILEAIETLDRKARNANNADDAAKYYNAMEKLYSEYNRVIEIDNNAYFNEQKDKKEELRIQEDIRRNIEAREIEKRRDKIELAKIVIKVLEILAAVIGLPCLVLFQLKCQNIGAMPPKFMDTIVNRAIQYLSL